MNQRGVPSSGMACVHTRNVPSCSSTCGMCYPTPQANRWEEVKHQELRSLKFEMYFFFIEFNCDILLAVCACPRREFTLIKYFSIGLRQYAPFPCKCLLTLTRVNTGTCRTHSLIIAMLQDRPLVVRKAKARAKALINGPNGASAIHPAVSMLTGSVNGGGLPYGSGTQSNFFQ